MNINISKSYSLILVKAMQVGISFYFLKCFSNNNLSSVFYVFLLLFNYSCPHFPLLLSTVLSTPHLTHSILPPTPLSLSMGPLYMFLKLTLPLLSPVIPLSLPSGHCQFVLYFHVSLFCSLVCFVDQVPLVGEIIGYLSLTIWLISLSIMLSRSIHAIMKCRSSFFLSAAQYSIV